MSASSAPSTALSTAAPIPPTLGFSTLDREVTVDELELSGELPGWLGGSLLRTGPAKFEVGEQRMRHWFDGLAMLHRFTIGGGRVSYGNRFLDSRSYRAAREQGRIVYGEFATDPCRSLFKRVQTLFSPGAALPDNANINVTRLGERFIAMTETPLPVQFDPHTLTAAGVRPYEVPGQLSTAHPHLDRASSGCSTMRPSWALAAATGSSTSPHTSASPA
jgi:beta,beta-carotene 9',10'-dioxygenase